MTKGKKSVEAEQPQPVGIRVPRREEWVDVAPDVYPGLQFQMWINHPPRLRQIVLTSGSEKEKRDALIQIAVAHNDWLDFDGKPYPPMNTPSFWDVIPADIAMAVLHHISTNAFTLPNSLRGNRTN